MVGADLGPAGPICFLGVPLATPFASDYVDGRGTESVHPFRRRDLLGSCLVLTRAVGTIPSSRCGFCNLRYHVRNPAVFGQGDSLRGNRPPVAQPLKEEVTETSYLEVYY